jgi:hypothetical protein
MAQHNHILQRIHEELGLTPNAGVGTMAGNVATGDASLTACPVKKEGDEFRQTDPEECQEIKIADAILQAASGLANSPAAEEIKRQAQELKRIHGVQ